MEAGVLIRKQKVILRTADEQQALRMRLLMNDILQQKLSTILENAFKKSAPTEVYVNIDKITIDIGRLTEAGFEKNFTDLLEKKLVQQLDHLLQDHVSSIQTSSKQSNDFNENAGDGASLQQLNPNSNYELNALIYFLEHGIYPWWYPRTGQKTPVQLLESYSDTDIDALLIQLISLRKRRSSETLTQIILRLFNFLTPSAHILFTNGLLNLYHQQALSKNAEVITKNADELSAVFSLPINTLHTQLFSFILQHHESVGENFLLNFFRRLISDQHFSLDEWMMKQQTLSLVPEINNLLSAITDEHGKAGRTKYEDNKMQYSAHGDTFLDQEAVVDQAKGIFSEKKLIEQGIYIDNAGLLLLHPFLSYFFADADLLTSTDQFLSEKAKYKAAVLLYYLQSGETEYQEWDMAFNKLLCGLNPQTVLPTGILLSVADKENAEILLKAAVQHWEALKGSGIAALRNTFLLRQGKISRKDDHWLLQVERTGADVLLDRLPWGLSTVKLPWLDQLIFTEW